MIVISEDSFAINVGLANAVGWLVGWLIVVFDGDDVALVLMKKIMSTYLHCCLCGVDASSSLLSLNAAQD